MRSLATIAVALLIAPLCLVGQERPGHSMERIESFKKVRMMEVLKLDEQLSIKFLARYNKHHDDVRALEQESNHLVDKLESLIAGGAGDDEYARTFAELREIGKKTVEARMQFVIDLKDILTQRQIAEYVVFERKFGRELRNILRDVQRERFRGRN